MMNWSDVADVDGVSEPVERQSQDGHISMTLLLLFVSVSPNSL